MITDLNGIATLEVAGSGGSIAHGRGDELGWAGRCRTTRWSVVFAAARGGASAREALSRLYRAYWYPLFAVAARRRGREAAAELLQEFFTCLIDRGDLSRVSPRPGKRFRGWMFTALRCFLINQSKYEQSKCRDVRRTVSFVADADGDELGPSLAGVIDPKPNPEQRLGREQALQLLSKVLRRLRQEYCEKASAAGVNGELRFDVMKVFLPGRDMETSDYQQAARSLGLGPDAFKRMVSRQRRRFGHLLQDELAKSATCGGDVASARRALYQALSNYAPPELLAPKRSGT